MGDVRSYEKDPPPLTDSVDPSEFGFEMVSVTKTGSGTGWEKYKITLPPHVRQLHSSCVINGAQWRELIAEFDKKLPSLSVKCGWTCGWLWLVLFPHKPLLINLLYCLL